MSSSSSGNIHWRVVQPQQGGDEEQPTGEPPFYAYAPLVLLPEQGAAAAAPQPQEATQPEDPSSSSSAAAAAETTKDNSSGKDKDGDDKDTAAAAAASVASPNEPQQQQTTIMPKEEGQTVGDVVAAAAATNNNKDTTTTTISTTEAAVFAAEDDDSKMIPAAVGVLESQQQRRTPTATASPQREEEAASANSNSKDFISSSEDPPAAASDSKLPARTASDNSKNAADSTASADDNNNNADDDDPLSSINTAAAAAKQPQGRDEVNNAVDDVSSSSNKGQQQQPQQTTAAAAAAQPPKDEGASAPTAVKEPNVTAAAAPPNQQDDRSNETATATPNQRGNNTAATAESLMLFQTRSFAEDAEHRYPAFVRHYYTQPQESQSQQQQQQQQKYAVDAPAALTETTTAATLSSGAAAASIPPARSVARATAVLQQRLAHAPHEQHEALLRRLLWRAVLEECQAAWYRARKQAAEAQQQNNSSAAKPGSSSIFSTSHNFDNDDDDDSALWLPAVSFTPAQLVQRIKQGCAAAWRQQHEKLQWQQQRWLLALQQQQQKTEQQQQPPPPQPIAVASRRSRRAAATSTKYTNSSSEPPSDAAAAPRQQQSQQQIWWKVQPGGRVARALLDDENGENKSRKRKISNRSPGKSEASEPDGDTKMAADSNGNDDDDDDDSPQQPDEMDASHEEEEEEEEDAVASDEEEEELMEEDDEDDDDDEDEILVTQNPYLQPDRTALLEWLGRKLSKTMSTLDVQPLLADMVHFDIANGSKKKKKQQRGRSLHELGAAVDELWASPVDRLIVAELFLLHSSSSNSGALWPRFASNSDPRVVADFLFGSDEQPPHEQPRLVLQPPAAYEADDADLTAWEVGSFSRTQFSVRLVNAAAAAALKEERAAVAQQQEALEQDRRAWENYRAKGTLVGYCQWSSGSSESSSWMQVAAAALPGAGAGAASATKTDSEEGAAAAAVAAAAAAAATGSTVSDDLALAQALGATSGRRKTRRDGGGVFYGNQSSMTAKQLMDALLRIISGSSEPVSLAGLLHVAPDESSDPMRRIRMAVGKLVWKRNQLARLEVQMEWSDAPIWSKLCQGPIWRPPTTTTPSTSAAAANGAPVAEDGAAAAASTAKASASGAESDEESLVRYVRSLHQTELQLRALVMAKICEFPVAFIATAADERAGSMEAMDNSIFEDTANIQWHSSGHELLGSRILRPATARETSESSVCSWFEISAYVPPVESSGVPEDPAEIGRAKEPTAVECRMRFLAVPVSNNYDDVNNNRPPSLILTEAQVRAGIKAAEIDQSSQSDEPEMPENPFISGYAEILLLGTDRNAPPTSAVVVGHESAASMEDNRIQHKILLLPNKGSASEEAFWATLDLSSPSGAISCTADGNGKLYTIQPRDFHPSSAAYQECLAIVRFLQRHPKGVAFLEPVDPVALGIPDYFSIIEHPMDVSTLLKKLERGDYAIIPPGQMKGHSPVFRMLNGPFRRDVELIFDNAMLFNPPDDWIHQAAAVIKKSVTRKIDQASSAAERLVRQRKQKSVYIDYDSDVDMYVYETDEDDDYNGKRKRKRKSASASRVPPAKEDSCLRAIERGIRLQKVLSDSVGLRGPFSKIPLSTNASEFSLPSEWSCRHKTETADQKVPSSGGQESDALPELDELMELHRLVEESEHVGIRRSTRAHDYEQDANESAPSLKGVEYFSNSFPSSNEIMSLPGNRLEIELARERIHESHFAKLYQTVCKNLGTQNASDQLGVYSKGFFPPYLGRIVPLMSPYASGEKTVWEIREQFVVPALRWVIRGLIHSEHLTEVEPLDSAGGVIIPNHLYYIDESQNPFDILDTKELTRRKRADAEEEASSEEEVELSEYEKARAERVARNKERLQALGLA